MAIKCCKDCVPPTRYPGCHDKCNKYLKEKAEYEKQKEYAKAHKTVILTKYDFEMLACMHRPYKDKRRR